MFDEDIEKLQVAKGYLKNIVGWSLVGDVYIPDYGEVSEDEKRQALKVIKTYYSGCSITKVRLDY